MAKILVIDDWLHELQRSTEALLKMGHEVVPLLMKAEGHGGEWTLEGTNYRELKNLPQELKADPAIDLVITDLYGPGDMPYGRYLVKEVREQKITTPIIVQSRDNEQSYFDQVLRHDGADAFVQKGQDKTLQSTIEKLTQKQRSASQGK